MTHTASRQEKGRSASARYPASSPTDRFAGVRRFILIIMLVVPLIPFLAALFIGNQSFSRSLENGAIASMKRIADDHRQMIASFLLERRHDLDLLVSTVGVDQLTHPATLKTAFLNLQHASSAFIDLGVFDPNGVHLAYHGPYDLTGKIYRDTVWFRQTLENGIYISDVFLGYRNVPHFIIAVARMENGRQWVVRATVDSQRFNNLVRQVRIGKTGEAYLVNRDGVLQTDRRSGGNLMEKITEKIPLPPADDQIHTFIHRQQNGEPFLYATAWLKDQNWLLVVRQEEADAFSALRQARMPILLIFLLGGAVIVVAAFALTNTIVNKMARSDAEKALLNQQLIGASRLAELGEMAAGFAHEINNPLQIMSTELTMIRVLQTEMRDSGEVKPGEALDQVTDSLNQIKLQIDRCSRITAAILKFGRQGESSAENLDLTATIPEIVQMVAKKAEVNDIRLTCQLPQQPVCVVADASRLQQIILNLLNNAMDAIADSPNGNDGMIAVTLAAGDEGIARIAVRDNGSGISSENMEKIFSPFFTTKPVGKGTGLGLSVCFGIVQQMGGQMGVESQPGQGTTFSIELPTARQTN